MPGKGHGTQAGKEDGMQITSSYGVEIRKVGSPVSLTYRVYRDAVRVLALFYDTVWEELSRDHGQKAPLQPCGAPGARHEEEPGRA